MAKIQPVINAEIDPLKPVPEICAVIAAILAYHPQHKVDIIMGVMEACQQQLTKLQPLKPAEKGAESNGEPIHEPERKREDIRDVRPDK